MVHEPTRGWPRPAPLPPTRLPSPVSCLLSLCLLLVALPAAAAPAILIPENPTQDREIRALDERLRTFIGAEWEMSAEKTQRLWGWEGETRGYVFSFRHKALRLPAVNNAAASFRFTVAGYPLPARWAERRPGDPAPDVPMGWGKDYFVWFCGGETYAAGSPKEWAALLAKVRDEFGIAEPVGGIQCRVQALSAIFRADMPISVIAEATNVSGKALAIPDTRARFAETTRLLDAGGKAVPCRVAVEARDLNPGGTRDLRPWGDCMATLKITSAGAPFPPGLYTVETAYLRDEEGKEKAQAAGRRVRVVPADFMALEMRPAGEARIAPGASSAPMTLTLNVGPAQGERIEDFAIAFAAGTQGRPILFNSRVWGRLTKEELGQLREQAASAAGGKVTLSIDLGKVHWSDPLSSTFQSSDLGFYMKPGETWHVTASVEGSIGGLRFCFPTEPVKLVRP